MNPGEVLGLPVAILVRLQVEHPPVQTEAARNRPSQNGGPAAAPAQPQTHSRHDLDVVNGDLLELPIIARDVLGGMRYQQTGVSALGQPVRGHGVVERHHLGKGAST